MLLAWSKKKRFRDLVGRDGGGIFIEEYTENNGY